MTTNKLRVAVIYGGKSGEHEVSLRSAYSILRFIDRDRFEPIPIGIDKDGRWHWNDPAEVFLPNASELLVTASKSKALRDPSQVLETNSQDKSLAKINDFQTDPIPVDVVFPCMHGPLGEDGCVQGVLEFANLPYVGAGVLGSALAMDKSVAKMMIRGAGIPTPNFTTVFDYFPKAQLPKLYQDITVQLGPVVFVKPARLGSSVGISRVTNQTEFIDAFELASRLDTKIIIEQGVNARELEMSVLDNPSYGQPPLVSVAGEIVTSKKHIFYSYDAKYLDNEGAQLMAPADITADQLSACQALARQAYQVLDCEGMARVDMFLEHNTGRILLNEVNTIPGFTSISMYPRMWEASGLPYSELITRLIDLALARHQRRSRLITDYQLIRL